VLVQEGDDITAPALAEPVGRQALDETPPPREREWILGFGEQSAQESLEAKFAALLQFGRARLR
jgi:hypothetical protein